MNMELKEVIPKFRYLNILGEIDVPTKIAPRPENHEVTVRDLIPKKSVTNRSATRWNFYTFQGLTVWIAPPKL